jgi:hypothetical protein
MYTTHVSFNPDTEDVREIDAFHFVKTEETQVHSTHL